MMKKPTLLIAISVLALSLVGCNSTGGNQNSGGDPSGGGSDNPPAHEHTYSSDWSSDENYHWHAATCEHSSEVIDKEKHTFGEWIIDNQATEQEEGTKHKTCSICGFKLDSTIDILDHIHIAGEQKEVNRVDATCTDAGSYDLVTYCSSCGEVMESVRFVIDALGHDYLHHDGKEATCTEDGWKSYDTCSRCDYTTFQTIPAKNHNWTDPIYTWNSDYSACTASISCENDSAHTISETVKSNILVVKPATIDENGETEYTAIFNNKLFSEQVILVKTEYVPFRGQYPLLSEDTKTIEYGLYPQKLVENTALVEELEKSAEISLNGWYEYKKEFYVKLIAKPNEACQQFDNGQSIISGNEYWFKCTPIKWNVLSSWNGKYFVAAKHILNFGNLDTASNWLTNEFLSEAFIFSDDNLCPVYEFGRKKDPEVAKTTNKIILPGIEHFSIGNYGITGTTDRRATGSEWLRASGIFTSNNNYDGLYYNTSKYWTQTRYGSYVPAQNYCISEYGDTEKMNLTNVCGIRPCAVINIDSVEYDGNDLIFDKENNQFVYGIYPQSNVYDEELINSLNQVSEPDSNGYYLYEGNYYVKQISTSSSYSRTFRNGIQIENNSTYWFKCEPLRWSILSQEDNTYYIVCDSVIDWQCYYHSLDNRTIDNRTITPTNFEFSDIRYWLNTDFLKKAFNNNQFILNTQLESYDGGDEFIDRIVLPSYKEYSSSQLKTCIASDYVKATGDLYIYYWTRTPSGWVPDTNPALFDINGEYSYGRKTSSTSGVRPAMTVIYEAKN